MKKAEIQNSITSKISKDSVFIRLSDQKDVFIFVKSESDTEIQYEAKKVHDVKNDLKGAAIWHRRNARKWIKHQKAANLEIVRVKDIV